MPALLQRLRVFPICACCTLATMVAVAQQTAPAPIVLHAARLLQVDTGALLQPGEVLIEADRIAAVAKQTGVKQIDYLLITHFHMDHVGGVPALAAKLPIRNFVDHGDTVEHDANGQKLFDAYQKEVARGNHIVVKPGDKLPVKGLDWTIVTAAGKTIGTSLPGAGKPNPDCTSFQKRAINDDENGQSTGSFIQFGSFKAVDLGDLLWNKEEALMCPVTKIPYVDVYITSHHGMNMSGSPSLVHGLHAKAAIMDNGATKGGTAEAWDTMHGTPGLADIWQLHFAVAGGPAHNSQENMIANMTETPDAANTIKLIAHSNGHFEIVNSRNNFSKKY